MGFTLVSLTTRDDIHLNIWAWSSVLRLARRYGWEPMGTEMPTRELCGTCVDDWNGTYFSNDGQTILSADAQAIAHALELALAEMPKAYKQGELQPPSAMETDSVFCGPEWEELIKTVIDICRKGAFYIQPLVC